MNAFSGVGRPSAERKKATAALSPDNEAAAWRGSTDGDHRANPSRIVRGMPCAAKRGLSDRQSLYGAVGADAGVGGIEAAEAVGSMPGDGKKKPLLWVASSLDFVYTATVPFSGFLFFHAEALTVSSHVCCLRLTCVSVSKQAIMLCPQQGRYAITIDWAYSRSAPRVDAPKACLGGGGRHCHCPPPLFRKD